MFDTYFNTLYFFCFFIAFFLAIEKSFRSKYYEGFENKTIILISILFVFLFGLRDHTVGTDTVNYIRRFTDFNYYLNYTSIKDFGFYSFMVILKNINAPIDIYLVVLSAMLMLPISICFNTYKVKNRFILFFLLISLFFFKNIGINILRQGVGIAIAMLVITKDREMNKTVKYMLSLLAISFHASIIILILLNMLSKRIKKLKYPLIIFFLVIPLSAIGLSLSDFIVKIPVLGSLIEQRMRLYIENEFLLNYNTGFRIDFIVFNTFFALIAIYLHKKNKDLKHTQYLILYLLTSSLFFLMFNLPFSDRYGILSWCLIPFVLSPMLNKNIVKQGSLVMVFLGLFIFMVFNF